LNSKEFEKHKQESLKMSIFISLFVFLFAQIYTKNLTNSFLITILFFIIIFLFFLQFPILKQKKLTRKIESELPFFLTSLITELRVGRNLFEAIKKCSKESKFAGKEYEKLVEKVKRGQSFQEAIQKMNSEFSSLAIKRVNSNLNNIYQNGNDLFSLKKFADELLLRQRIESKEFGGKMVVFALVFVAVSAIVPAMFISFILIGSYFMELQFTAIQIFIIIVFVFPLIDLMVLMMINSKTPVFLRTK
jgi:pilus assembly protein TadC